MSERLTDQATGLHLLAESLEDIGLPLSTLSVGLHVKDRAYGEALADRLGLADRVDFTRGDEYGADHNFTAWKGKLNGAEVTVYGDTPAGGDES